MCITNVFIRWEIYLLWRVDSYFSQTQLTSENCVCLNFINHLSLLSKFWITLQRKSWVKKSIDWVSPTDNLYQDYFWSIFKPFMITKYHFHTHILMYDGTEHWTSSKDLSLEEGVHCFIWTLNVEIARICIGNNFRQATLPVTETYVRNMCELSLVSECHATL